MPSRRSFEQVDSRVAQSSNRERVAIGRSRNRSYEKAEYMEDYVGEYDAVIKYRQVDLVEFNTVELDSH